MKGDKGKAWAFAVRATFFTQPAKQIEPKWKFSFEDHIDRKTHTCHLIGDFAPAFGLLDNRKLAKLLDLDDVTNVSTDDQFKLHAKSIISLRKTSMQLDDVLLACDGELNFSKTTSEPSFGMKLMVGAKLFQFLRIKDPQKKWSESRKILSMADSPFPLALEAWEEIAENYFMRQGAVHLAEPIFRRIQLYCIKHRLGKSVTHCAYRIGGCLYAKKQYQAAIEHIEQTQNLGFNSWLMTDIMALSRARLEDSRC